MIDYICPSCGGNVKVPDHANGHRGKCPKCSSVFIVSLEPKAEIRAVEQQPLAEVRAVEPERAAFTSSPSSHHPRSPHRPRHKTPVAAYGLVAAAVVVALVFVMVMMGESSTRDAPSTEASTAKVGIVLIGVVAFFGCLSIPLVFQYFLAMKLWRDVNNVNLSIGRQTFSALVCSVFAIELIIFVNFLITAIAIGLGWFFLGMSFAGAAAI